jgi:hypothetical protein
MWCDLPGNALFGTVEDLLRGVPHRAFGSLLVRLIRLQLDVLRQALYCSKLITTMEP